MSATAGSSSVIKITAVTDIYSSTERAKLALHNRYVVIGPRGNNRRMKKCRGDKGKWASSSRDVIPFELTVFGLLLDKP